jgi:hypothetical protein
MMLGVDFDDPDVAELSSTPKRAPDISPDPCGSGGGGSLAARDGVGDGALDGGAVDAPLSFLASLVDVV